MEKLSLTREDLQGFLDGLAAQRQKLVDDLNAVSGAIQFGELLLHKLDTPQELKSDDLVKEQQ